MKIERLDNWDMKPVTLMLTAENEKDVWEIKKLQEELEAKHGTNR